MGADPPGTKTVLVCLTQIFHLKDILHLEAVNDPALSQVSYHLTGAWKCNWLIIAVK